MKSPNRTNGGAQFLKSFPPAAESSPQGGEVSPAAHEVFPTSDEACLTTGERLGAGREVSSLIGERYKTVIQVLRAIGEHSPVTGERSPAVLETSSTKENNQKQIQ